MSRFKITTTTSGKYDIILTMFNENNSMVGQRRLTYDVKPTIKKLLNYAKTLQKDNGAKTVRITSTPSCCVKTYKL